MTLEKDTFLSRDYSPNMHEKKNDSNPGVGVKEITPIDGESLKREALQKCTDIFNNIQRIKKEIVHFQKVQKPAYDNWLQYHFGDKIREVNVLSEEIREKKQIMNEVQEELYFFHISPKDAYEKVKRRVKEGYYAEKIYQNKEKINYQSYEVTDEDDVMGEELNEFFSKLTNEEEVKKSRYKKLKERKFKERYRYLASKLHPDKKGKDLTEGDKELWDEIQVAYKNNDEKALEGLFARYKVTVGEINKESSLFDLRFSMKKLAVSLHNLKEKRRSIKKTEAWNFNKLDDKELFELQLKTGRELKELEESLKKEKRKIDEIIHMMAGGKEENEKKIIENRVEKEFIEMYLNF